MDTPVAYGRDVLAWHLASALCMGAMVAATLPPAVALVGIGLFVGGLAWCGVQLVQRISPAAYLRLGACCVAMMVMLVPGHGLAMHASMHGSTHRAMAPAAPSTVAIVLAVAMVVVAGFAARPLLARSGSARRRRAVGEALLSVAMAAMLVGLI